MKPLTVGLMQQSCFGNPAENIEKSDQQIHQAAAQGDQELLKLCRD